jgi:hypothetical protein
MRQEGKILGLIVKISPWTQIFCQYIALIYLLDQAVKDIESQFGKEFKLPHEERFLILLVMQLELPLQTIFIIPTHHPL